MCVDCAHRTTLQMIHQSPWSVQQFWTKTIFSRPDNPIPPRSRPLLLFALLKQILRGRNKILSRRANPGEFGKVSARNCNKGDPIMLSSMETMLDNVFGFRRKLFRKRLNTELMCCRFLFYRTSFIRPHCLHDLIGYLV